MILGQLIQTGRHFCECRSHDFIPKSEDRLVVISYCIHDQLLAHSFDHADWELEKRIREKLQEIEAVAYILIQRINHRSQTEFPSPIGRSPMDRVILTAATPRDFLTEAYYLEKATSVEAYRLISTSLSEKNSIAHESNLFHSPAKQTREPVHYLFPELAEIAG
ncbi:hypothetical protein [Pelagicoccus mobilis]|uniref:Uncharacterized protein n=1 Tax=Pelagicoccus mobilis TaxID=415221 RepID=A0A934S0C7_9BACT|nr:hypothetical protein [Pelagicoccus mobilis]MBK1879986.1 hypothetical protein [Pelagicoccus mobilis]